MNIQNCRQCNFPIDGADRFCKNCGATAAESAAPGLPPTVFGAMPPPAAPNQFQPPSHSQPPPPHMMSPVPQKSGRKGFALIGGIFGVIFVLGGICALLIVFVTPYLEEQSRLKKERENQTRANSTAAISLLPEEYVTTVTGGNSQTFRRNRTLDRLQLLEASQKLPPKLREAVKDVNDAATAEYVSTTDGSRKVLLQIFKFGSPAQAVALCDEIGRELKSKQASFKEVNYYPANAAYPTDCGVSAEDGNKGLTGVSTMYGFFIIYSGLKENNPKEARNQVGNKLGV